MGIEGAAKRNASMKDWICMIHNILGIGIKYEILQKTESTDTKFQRLQLTSQSAA